MRKLTALICTLTLWLAGAARAEDPKPPELAKATKRGIESGLAFGPEIVDKAKTALMASVANKKTLLIIGPAVPEGFKPPKQWLLSQANPKVVGPTATPRVLLTQLPELLAKEKPEVVLIAAEGQTARKPTSTEREDWEDILKVCIRMGAVPIFSVPLAEKEEKDETLQNLLRCIESLQIPAVSQKPPQMYSKRVELMLGLLDAYVFGRAKAPGTAKPEGDE